MENLPKVLESVTKIRFQDCDPFNHLNNAEYLNYMINAREDQLIEHYGIDIYEMGRKEGKSWVVGSTQIAYIRPAFTMEEVKISSQLLQFSDNALVVEMRMSGLKKGDLKAFMWSNFVHFNLLTQKKEQHSEKFMNLFKAVANPLPETTFEQRISTFRSQKV